MSRSRSDSGASLVEYALLLALIAVVCVGAMSFFGQATSGNISDSGTKIASAN